MWKTKKELQYAFQTCQAALTTATTEQQRLTEELQAIETENAAYSKTLAVFKADAETWNALHFEAQQKIAELTEQLRVAHPELQQAVLKAANDIRALRQQLRERDQVIMELRGERELLLATRAEDTQLGGQ